MTTSADKFDAFIEAVNKIPTTDTPEIRERKNVTFKENQTSPLFHAMMDTLALLHAVHYIDDHIVARFTSVVERLEDAYKNDLEIRKVSPSWSMSRIADRIIELRDQPGITQEQLIAQLDAEFTAASSVN